MESNQIDSVRLRRYLNQLTMSGLGCIVFGIWSGVRLVLTMYLRRAEILELLQVDINMELAEAGAEDVVFYIVLSVIVLVALFAILVHLFVGLSAMKEGRGKKHRTLYLFIALLLLYGTVTPWINGSSQAVAEGTEQIFSMDTGAVAVLLDIGMAFTFIDMLYSAIRARLLQRKIGGK